MLRDIIKKIIHRNIREEQRIEYSDVKQPPPLRLKKGNPFAARRGAEGKDNKTNNWSSSVKEDRIQASHDPDRPLATNKGLDRLKRYLDDTFRFIAVDVETANSNRHSICQIGLAFVDSQGIIKQESILIEPKEEFANYNVKLHGIDENLVRGAPLFSDILQILRPLLERHPLIQHSTFDKSAFDQAAAVAGLPTLKAQWFNSVKIARNTWPELREKGGHGLGNLKKQLHLSFEHHDAGEDARAAAEIVLMAEHTTGLKFDELAISSEKKERSYPSQVTVEGNQNGPLYGHIACFTGSLSISRTEAATIAAGAGITVKSSVSKKVSLVVVGDQDLSQLNGKTKSNKHLRAEELASQGHSIRIIGEREFLELLNR